MKKILLLSALVLSSVGSASGPFFEKFVDPLPIPPVIKFDGASAEITVKMTQFKMKFHRDLPETLQWGYNGTFPGPTIEVNRGQKLTVHWKNELPAKHLLDLPANADMGDGHLPDVRTVVHLHGAAVSEPQPMDRARNNDGWPDAWFTTGQEQIAEYPNDQTARILWYHDHAMGTTGRNVAAGLSGMYLIHDDYEASLNLPSGKYDIPIIMQARGLNGDASLYYTRDITAEFYGNALLVNGKIWPYLEVEPRKYRFRLLNASNARALWVKINKADNVMNSGPALNQIGSDGGFLAKTVTINPDDDNGNDLLILDPAERADVIVDFSQYAGQKLLLRNYAKPDDNDGQILIPDVMMFKVKPAVNEPDTSSLPIEMKPIQRLDPSTVAQTRQIVLSQMAMPNGSSMMMLNNKSWTDPITETPKLGTTEVWELVNTMAIGHPFHIHLVQFQVIDRRPFDVKEFNNSGKVVYTGPAEQPDENEMGWKDTVRATRGEVTRIIMRFEPFPGYYVYHCHILEHEDMDMMRPFQVVP